MPDPVSGAGAAKLFQTLFTLGLAPLLRPMQMRREGKASAHNQYRLKLAEAQAEADIEDIRAGRKSYDPVKGELISISHVPEILPPQLALEHIAPEAKEFVSGVAQVALQDAVRRTNNLADTIAFAQEEIEKQPVTDTSPSDVDEDWFQRWRSGAEGVGKPDIQKLWGRLLADEVNQPGSSSLHTLEVLRRISSSDAKRIGSALAFTIGGTSIFKDLDCLTANGLVFDDLVLLEELGITGPIDVIGGRTHFWNTPPNQPGFAVPLSGGLGLVFTTTQSARLEVPAIELTRVGRDIFRISAPGRPPMPYIQRVAEDAKSKGFGVTLGEQKVMPNGDVAVVGAQIL